MPVASRVEDWLGEGSDRLDDADEFDLAAAQSALAALRNLDGMREIDRRSPHCSASR